MTDIGIDFSNEKEFLERMHKPGFFAFESGVTVTEINKEHCLAQLDVTDKNLNLSRIVHGGALVTLADTVAGAYIHHNGGRCVTTNETFQFLRPATGSVIYCKGTPKKMGNVLSTVDVTLWNDTGKEVACGSFTFYMLPKE